MRQVLGCCGCWQRDGTVIVLKGARLHVEEWGSGPALLCLHGLGGGAHFFAALGTALQDRYRTIAPDFPGAGFSPSLSQFSFDALADVVVDLVERTGGCAQAIIGHSMGTIVALEAFRRAPGAALGFIAVGGLSDPLAGARARIATRARQIRRNGLSGLGATVASANLSRETLDRQPGLAALFARLFETQSAAGYLATAEALAQWDARQPPPLEGVRCLAVTGEQDLYAPPEAMRAFATTLPPGTEVEVIPGAAHLPFLEQPAAFAAVVSRFLNPST